MKLTDKQREIINAALADAATGKSLCNSCRHHMGLAMQYVMCKDAQGECTECAYRGICNCGTCGRRAANFEWIHFDELEGAGE